MLSTNRFVKASKELGWNDRKVPYPSSGEVDKAIAENDCFKLLAWNRFLRTPESETQHDTMVKVVAGLKSARAWAEAHPEE